LDEIRDWKSFVNEEESKENLVSIRKHLSTGRPLGHDAFIDELERLTGMTLRKKKTGPKKDEDERRIFPLSD
jgi:hypothetical protein